MSTDPTYEQRMNDAMLDSFDEELEMEFDDNRMDSLIDELASTGGDETELGRNFYFKELFRLQDWVVHKKLKVVVLFEGRDAAGKGGVIKRITQRLNPRVCRVAALPAPSAREQSQWYFQRYVSHLPAGGEIVLFDRSWYNRAGVEKVMGFCNEDEYEEFFRSVPEFEKMLIRSGKDPLKQWKLSPMDMESRRRWEQYTKAKEIMLERTHIPEAPWWIVEAVDKKKARLNCIHHFLSQIPYEEIERESVVLPERVHNPDYLRHPVPKNMIVPPVY